MPSTANTSNGYGNRSEDEKQERNCITDLKNELMVAREGGKDGAFRIVKEYGTDMYMYPFSPKPPSHPGCHITLSRVLCAIQ